MFATEKYRIPVGQSSPVVFSAHICDHDIEMRSFGLREFFFIFYFFMITRLFGFEPHVKFTLFVQKKHNFIERIKQNQTNKKQRKQNKQHKG